MENATGVPTGTSSRLNVALLLKSLSAILSDKYDLDITLSATPKPPRKEAEA